MPEGGGPIKAVGYASKNIIGKREDHYHGIMEGKGGGDGDLAILFHSVVISEHLYFTLPAIKIIPHIITTIHTISNIIPIIIFTIITTTMQWTHGVEGPVLFARSAMKYYPYLEVENLDVSMTYVMAISAEGVGHFLPVSSSRQTRGSNERPSEGVADALTVFIFMRKTVIFDMHL